MTLSEKARKWATWAVATVMGFFHGRDAWDFWLWNMTPFPAGVPRWSEIAFGLAAALVPGPVHRRLMDRRARLIDEEITRAMKRMRQDSRTHQSGKR
jgi:hypothetical protein